MSKFGDRWPLFLALSLLTATVSASPGSLDLTFGTGGTVATSLGDSSRANSVTVQPDGKILVAGNSSSNGSMTNFALVRYLATGEVDPSFGNNGTVVTSFGVASDGASVALQNDGKIVVGGTGNDHFALARYQENGALDTGFGNNGKIVISLGGHDACHAIVVQADGILVAGESDGNFALVRYTSSGSLDVDFADQGLVITDFGHADVARGLAVQDDGKIVLAGNAGGNFALARYSSTGRLDPDFGSGGKVITDIGGVDAARGVVIQSDGKILVAGDTYNNNDVATSSFAVARYSREGNLDPDFGNGGKLTSSFNHGYNFCAGVALQTDGKILVGGSDLFGDYLLARYTDAGELDASFNGGLATTYFSLEGKEGVDAAGLAVQHDGRIVLAGVHRKNEGGSSSVGIGVGRFDGNFPLDVLSSLNLSAGVLTPVVGPRIPSYETRVTLATSSVTVTPTAIHPDATMQVRINGGSFSAIASGQESGALELHVGDNVMEIAVTQPEGNTTWSYTVAVVVTRSKPGDLDSTFGAGGIVMTDLGGNNDHATGVAVQGDGKILVAGDYSRIIYATPDANVGILRSDFALVRYTKTGELDTSFGGGGKVITDFDGSGHVCGVAVQNDGKLLVAGGNGYFLLVRYTETGALDTSFGDGGKVNIRAGGLGRGASMVVQPDGKIIVAGSADEGNLHNFALIRVTSSGQLDSSFGHEGLVTTAFGAYAESRGMALQADGKILVTGYAGTYPQYDIALVRYTDTGALDANFGSGGKVLTDFGGLDVGNGVTVQSDGKIVVVGYTGMIGSSDWALARYTESGELDPSFGDEGKVISDFDGDDTASGVVLQRDGKILVAGSTGLSGGAELVTVARYTGTGALDSSFGFAGEVPVIFSNGMGGANSVCLQEDGRILVAGANGADFAVVRLDGEPPRDALTALTSSVGKLFPYASPTQAAYAAFVSDTTDSITLKPTAVDANATVEVRVNGGSYAVVPPGGTSSALAVNLGENLVEIRVTAPGGSTRSYSVTVVRGAPAANAYLTSLTFAPDALRPAFQAAVTRYAASVSNAISALAVKPTTAGANATVEVRINGGSFAPVPAGDASGALALKVGANVVEVQVTAPDGHTMKTYTVEVTRAAPPATGGGPGGLDRIKPVVKITSPATGVVTGPFVLSGTVKENVDLSSFTVTLNGAPLTLDASLDFTANTVLTWTVSGVVPENGVNTVVVEAVDARGNRGVAKKTLTFVNNRPGLAGTFSALLAPTGTPANATVGLVSVKVSATGTFTGRAQLGGVSRPFIGLLRNDGTARFRPALGDAIQMADRTRQLGALAFTVSEADGLAGTLTGSGGPLAHFAGEVAPYNVKNPVPAELLNLPVTAATQTTGAYNVAFPRRMQSPDRNASTYPQGSGWASLTLRKAGAVSLSGSLADGSRYVAGGLLRADRSVALYTPLYGDKGAFAGEFAFADEADTDVASAGFLWLRPNLPRQKTYAAGWLNGLWVDAIGTKYAGSLDFGQGPASQMTGNASLNITGGLYVGQPSFPVNIDPVLSAVSTIPAAGAPYRLSVTAASGRFSGTFSHSDGSKPRFSGILLSKGMHKGGFGYFLSVPTTATPGQGGGVFLDPDGP